MEYEFRAVGGFPVYLQRPVAQNTTKIVLRADIARRIFAASNKSAFFSDGKLVREAPN
jgi:hypothetical protein